jgi:hypothetical protein
VIRTRRPIAENKLALTVPALTAATAGLVLFDAISLLSGDSFVPGGPADEAAHLLTTLIVIWALGPTAARRFMAPALIASVAIDIDHIPGRLGADWLTSGTPRPYTHSLLTIVVVLGAAALWRSRRDLLIAVGLGLAIHFWRDLAEPGSGVSLLWPFSDHGFSMAHTVYAGTLIGLVAIDAYRARGSGRLSRREPVPDSG